MKFLLWLAFFASVLFTTSTVSAQSQRWLQLRREGAGHTLNDVFFTDLMHGVAVGNAGTVVATTDGGEHWFEGLKHPFEDLYAIGFTDPSNGSMPGQQGYNYYTTDGGFTWDITANGIPSWVGTLNREYINPYSRVGFIGGGPMIDVGGGNTWTPMTIKGMRTLEGVGFADGNRGMMVDDLGQVFLTSDGGSNWSEGKKVLADPFSALEYPQIDTAFAASGPKVYRSTDGGKTWNDIGPQGVGRIASISFHNARLGMGVSADAKVFSTTNGGETWEIAPTIGYPTRVRLYDATHAVIVGGGGTLTESTDFGKSWSIHIGKFSNDLLSVVCPTPNRVITSGVGGLIAYSDDGGIRWIRVTGIPNDGYKRLLFTDQSVGLAIGDSNVLRTTDGGTTWQKLTIANGKYYGGAFMFDARNIVVTGFPKMLYRSTDGGESWTTDLLNFSYPTMVHFSDTEHGFIDNYLTSDGGKTWTEDTANHLFAMQTEFWVTPNYGFVAGQSGIQGRTHDGGRTWRVDTIKNGGYTKSIFMTDSLNGTLVTGGDVVWHTTDGGTIWQPQFRDSVTPSGTRGLNAVAFATPEIGYAVGYNGLILKTTNGTSLRVSSERVVASPSSIAFPNPTSSSFHIAANVASHDPAHVTIYNELGKAVLEYFERAGSAGERRIYVSVSHLPAGVYFYRLTVGAQIFSGREFITR